VSAESPTVVDREGPSAPIGERVRNIDWEARTSGAARYTADVELPGTLTARILRSPHAHARITALDASGAARADGVAAVLTAADLPEARYIHHGGPMSDRRVLARDVVRFAGEEVAAVAAETPRQAEAALRRFRVRYEPLPVAATVQAARAEGAPRIHEHAADPLNVALRIQRRWGDPSAAARAHVTVRDRYRFNRQTHVTMETNSVLASWDAGRALLDVWVSTQAPLLIRKEIAAALGLDIEQVLVHEVAVGGGFGSKSKISEYEVIAAALSRKTGRPVRLILSRDEDFAATKCRHDFEIELETGADADGRLTHRAARMTVDNGAYNHTGPSVMGYGTLVTGSLYRTAGVELDAALVYTNKHPGGQFRGYGGPQATFAIESQMDELADRLGLDPVELRIANANQPGDVTHAGWRLASGRLAECLATARDAIGWNEKRPLGGSGRGVGIAAAIHVSGANVHPGAEKSAAAVDIRADGTALVRFGGADAGTGQKTILAQIAAAELGLDLGAVEVLTMETGATPEDAGAWSSRGTYISGHAVGTVARKAAHRLRELAAERLGAEPGDVSLGGGVASAGDAEVAVGELVGDGAVLSFEEDIVAADMEPLDPRTGQANISGAYSFAAQAVEVEVDRATGRVRVLDAVAVHDSGRVLNPIAVESQIVGGMAMGLGAGLGEELIYEEGRLVNGAYINYAMPRAADLPRIRAILLDADDPHGPYGAKGIGEISLVPAPAALANAVAHAVGVRVRELPVTPDKVLAGLRAGEHRPRRRYGLWRRPRRWWIAGMRAAYPRGVHRLLHRYGTRLARPLPHRDVQRLSAPASLDEAVGTLAARKHAAPLAGGTDLLPARRQGVAQPAELVDVAGLDELGRLEESAAGDLRIGAGVRLAELLRRPELEADTALREAVQLIASPQIRAMATVGGNLCQQKRCWFFRNGFMCYKRGGPTCPCYAVTGDHRFYHAAMDAHRCQAVTPSDLATVLEALDAAVELRGPAGARTLPVAEFFTGPGETALRDGELLTAVAIDARARARVSCFEKLRLWEGDFAVAAAAVSLGTAPDGTIADARVVLGAIAPTAIRLPEVEAALNGHRPEALRDLEAISEGWIARAHPLERNEWKLDAAAGLVRRALERCGCQANGGRTGQHA
jgi:CO/xanthine dehydrogenase Mo-binding subunit/CO/xanthine dehydrogenase FAD-binding subunit